MYITAADRCSLRVTGGNAYSKQIDPNQEDIIALISDKIGFNPELMRKDKSGHSIQIKETVHQEDVAVLNMHALNISKETNTVAQENTD